ncbi:MAG: dipeptidase [Acidimicrobiia bacterium]|nr:dipeptidase [Acidimicrobiia bacterium]
MGDPYAERAKTIHHDLPVVDGHNDLPWAIRTRAGGSLEAVDPSSHLPGYHTDIPRLLEGGVGAQFWSVYVPTHSEHPLRKTLDQIDLVDRMVADNPDHLAYAASASDVRRLREARRISCLLGAEGGHTIEDSLENLQLLYNRGVRYMTLTHTETLSWADSATDVQSHGGLTGFGRDVVREMNRIGMMVDISHVSVGTMHDALDVSRAPIVASHSSAFALAPHPRNVPDDVIERVADQGGVIMVNFYPPFVAPELVESSIAGYDEARRLLAELGDADAVEKALAGRWTDVAHGCDVGMIVDHIEHVAAVGGVDCVGIGSDFDGVDLLPEGLEDVSCFPNITAELLRRGWEEPEIRKILGDNALRVLEAVEHAAG